MDHLEGIRILYLHGLYDNYKSYRKKQIEEIVGISYIRSPDLKYQSIIMKSKTGYVISSILILIILIIVEILVSFDIILKIFLFILSALLVLVFYRITGMIVLRKCVDLAKEIIEKNILAFKPEIIITSDFSAISMCNVNSRISKIPVIMFSPSIMSFKKFTFSRMELDPDKFQCLMIIQSLNDKIVPTRDIMELISKFDEKQVKTHFIQGVGNLLPTYASVSVEQLRKYIVEVLEIASIGNYDENKMRRFDSTTNALESGTRDLISNRLPTLHSSSSSISFDINLPSLRKTIPVTNQSSKHKFLKYKSLSQELKDSGYNNEHSDENEQSPLIIPKVHNKSSIYDPKPNNMNELFTHLENIKEDDNSEYNSDTS